MSVIYKSEGGRRELLDHDRRLLDGRPVPAEHVRAPTREGETFVQVSGPRDAPPLVLLHGSGANTSMWQADIANAAFAGNSLGGWTALDYAIRNE